MADASDAQFERFLDAMASTLSDRTPAVQGFVRDLQARHAAGVEHGGAGVTAQTLVADLVSILSYFETRLNALEEAVSRC